jgi:hypothetical protein
MVVVDLMLISIGSAICLFVLLMEDVHSRVSDPRGMHASRRKLDQLVMQRVHAVI